ncbi:MAG: right-handed parallel beta-helix repeat-containing protein [Clostridia bacterium]|nr:right-handed parallel beta-helix repeat-containing protein [Clostridia bacterium]
MKKTTKIWLFSTIALVLVAGITISAVLINTQRAVYVPISERYLNKLETKAEVRREEICNSPNMEIPKGAKVIYLSPNGNDDNDGLSPATPFKTLERLSWEMLDQGTYVCFERGGTWRGEIWAAPGVTYTAYGEGAKPEIRGSLYDGAVDGNWEEVAPNIWRYSQKFKDDVGMIVMNGGEENGIKMLMDYSEEQTKEVVSKRDWNGYTSLEKNYEFVHDFGDRYTNKNNPKGGYVYLYCDKGNPAKIWNSIEFVTLGAIIRIGNGANVTIDNLCLKYRNYGVTANTCENLRIQNCEIGWIGGCIWRYSESGVASRCGNGVEIYGGCKNFVCDNNWVYQCYDAGLTQQYSSGGDQDIIMDGVHYTNNVIEKCVYSIEYFLGAPEEGAIATRYMANFGIHDNYFLDAGGFGMQRPDDTTPAHIKGWDHQNTMEGEFVIEDNVFMRSERMMIHTGCDLAEDAPIYRDNVFVQYADGQWGRHGGKPTTFEMYTLDAVKSDVYAENDFYVIER